MKMERLVIQLPPPLKARLDALRRKGYTASGYIRTLLEGELAKTAVARKRRTY
jgi:predicted DNA-binding protein